MLVYSTSFSLGALRLTDQQCAWQVNFNLSLQSFIPHIQGTRNLLDMALGSPFPPRFLFASSVSAAGFGKPGYLKEEYLRVEDAGDGIGYGQSKLVAEKVSSSFMPLPSSYLRNDGAVASRIS